MKKIFTLFKLIVVLAFYNNSDYAQLLVENFDYTSGSTLTTVSSIWTESPTGSVDIQVIAGNLTYPNYPSSGIGNMIALNGGNTRSGVLTNFTNISGNGSDLYASFLLNVTSTVDLNTTGDYFAAFRDTSGTSKRAYVYLDSISTSTFHIGLAKSSSLSLTWYGTVLNINTTYLIVINYVFQSGDDAVNLWVNPALTGAEPSPDIHVPTGADAGGLGGFHFLQRAASGDEEVDGLRIATSWSQAPLPVELTSFTANVNNNAVNLSWKTATEVNNYGFQVQRKKEKGKSWNKIGFVAGHGNSNRPNSYSFIDNNLSGGSVFYYRLKQIDVNGNFKYSDILTVRLNLSDKAQLMQNSPNPFNPSTSIKYFIPEQANVTIKIYDMLGREVTTLINNKEREGFHITFWNGRDKYGQSVSSGVYLCRLKAVSKAGSFSDTKKMTLLK